ncbi:MAG: hypothetical protein CVV47_02565 [Spirochaetae bacterium HGW-Spirochaetae-3]|nr:MAG: hypothetical protein CVV47_02565 [Spirochaetae bacterium HGW-Spirochaetae-3]
MKNYASAVLRFLLWFGVTSLCVSTVWMADAMLRNDVDGSWNMLYGIAAASIPVSIVIAAFITFFLLNRTVSSRALGHLVIMPLAASTLAGIALLLRFYDIPTTPGLAALPTAYRHIGQWLTDVANAPWLDFGGGLASFAAFVSAFWGCTRLSRGRPLLGAFIAPCAALIAIYLFTLYLSGPADALFGLLGFSVPKMLSTTILTGGSALALLLFDMLLARKPNGGRRDA